MEKKVFSQDGLISVPVNGTIFEIVSKSANEYLDHGFGSNGLPMPDCQIDAIHNGTTRTLGYFFDKREEYKSYGDENSKYFSARRLARVAFCRIHDIAEFDVQSFRCETSEQVAEETARALDKKLKGEGNIDA